MNDVEKVRYLIGHWIEHGREHATIYDEWAGKVESLEEGSEIASAFRAAAAKLNESVLCLMAVQHKFMQAQQPSCAELHDHADHHE